MVRHNILKRNWHLRQFSSLALFVRCFYIFENKKYSKLIFHYCVKNVQIRSFFWSVFPHIRTEYRDIFRISPYSVRIWQNTDQKKLRIWTLFMQCTLSPIQTRKLRINTWLSLNSLPCLGSWFHSLIFKLVVLSMHLKEEFEFTEALSSFQKGW